MRNTIARSGGFIENLYLATAVACISFVGALAFNLLIG